MSITAAMSKVIQVIAPTAINDNSAWTTVEVDSAGWSYAQFFFMLGSNDIAVATLKLQESDASGSGMTDIPGLVFGTSNNDTGSTSTLPASDDDNLIFSLELDLSIRKRYLDLSAVNGNGALGGFAAAWAVLSRGSEVPVTASDRGISQVLRTS